MPSSGKNNEHDRLKTKWRRSGGVHVHVLSLGRLTAIDRVKKETGSDQEAHMPARHPSTVNEIDRLKKENGADPQACVLTSARLNETERLKKKRLKNASVISSAATGVNI